MESPGENLNLGTLAPQAGLITTLRIGWEGGIPIPWCVWGGGGCAVARWWLCQPTATHQTAGSATNQSPEGSRL